MASRATRLNPGPLADHAMNFVIIPREEIRLESDGFVLTKGDQRLFTVRWDEIREIVAFKRDFLTWDCVFLAFRVDADDRYLEVNEEIPGFILLSDEMMSRFPMIPADWFAATTQPPLTTTWTRLFGEPPQVG